MRTPLTYLRRILQDMEDRWIPYSALWWRLWTPPLARGERYREGYFTGYPPPDVDDEDPMPPLDIRRMLAMPFVRRLYKKAPYIDVKPVHRPWDQMTLVERREREAWVVESTMREYDGGRALYPREVIRSIEEQLKAWGEEGAVGEDGGKWTRSKRKRSYSLMGIRQRLYAMCEAPQMVWIKFRDFDGVMQTVAAWPPGAKMMYSDGGAYYPRRSQIEFRTIQELTMPDPGWYQEPFVPDGWQMSVGYSPISVALQIYPFHGGPFDEPFSEAEMLERLRRHRERIGGSPEWAAFTNSVKSDSELGQTLASIDKIVFFSGEGVMDDCENCQRSMAMLALVTLFREFLLAIPDPPYKRLPIHMPEHDMQLWNGGTKINLALYDIHLEPSNGEMFLKIDERTAVVSYRDWNPVKQVVADIAKPAMLICRTVSDDPNGDFEWTEEQQNGGGDPVRVPKVRNRMLRTGLVSPDPDSPRVRKLVEDYDKFSAPKFLTEIETADDETITMYVRKAGTCTKVDYW